MKQKHDGFWGRMLRIDLSQQQISSSKIAPALFRRYMGGRNLALHFLLMETAPGVDPLGPDNTLVLTTSVVTGARISGQGRATIAARSPLTGGLGESQCGGSWGPELKFAGWDGIIVTGCADRPVYMLIEDEDVRILPADHLWGKDTGEVDDILRRQHSKKTSILQIGPAGENLVRFAMLTADLAHFAGRCGLGAVMGSKRLRAIVVKGSHRELRVADVDGLKGISRWFARSTKEHPVLQLHRELGTPKGVVPLSTMGMLPTYNFQDGSFAAAEAVSGETMKKEIGTGSSTCYACAVKCKRDVEGSRGGFEVTGKFGGPEYESLCALGPLVGVDDIYAIAHNNERCNALGLDTISTGATIAWAVECFQRGLIDSGDTGGIELDWNDPATYSELIRKIAFREGFGDVLAEGSRRAAQRIGRGTETFAMHVKGQEFPGHEPRGKWGVALGFAVSPTGADHLQAAHDPWFDKPGDYTKRYNWVDLEDLSPLGIIEPVPSEDLSPAKVRLFVYLQYIWSLHDVLDWCIFVNVPEFRALSLQQLVDIVQCVTGWRTSLFELLKAGERGVTMARAYNCREGFTSADDRLPARMFEPMRDGTLKGHKIDRQQFETSLDLYYGMMGWDERGKPSRAKLAELDVDWIWDQIAEVEERKIDT